MTPRAAVIFAFFTSREIHDCDQYGYEYGNNYNICEIQIITPYLYHIVCDCSANDNYKIIEPI